MAGQSAYPRRADRLPWEGGSTAPGGWIGYQGEAEAVPPWVETPDYPFA